jgi:DNA-binding NtrC family response regulator
VLRDGEDALHRAALLSSGALAVLNLRLTDAELRRALQVIARRLRDSATARLAVERLTPAGSLEGIVAESPAMSAAVGLVKRLARSDSSVLILGETGVGKERLARAIHEQSGRATGPFVPVNCGAIPEGLLESELFGHEKGAFTGAVRARRGYFEAAHGGTIFLDEVAELPLGLQVKLLRALEHRKIQRLGAEEPIQLDVRIVAATNRDLETEVSMKRFRVDLYYRLAVVTVTVPPLRERREDIAELVRSQLARFGAALGKPSIGIDSVALEAMVAYAWPGNVRELINVVERGVLLAQGPVLTVADLPGTLVDSPAASSAMLDGTRSLVDLDRPIRQARRAAVDGFERAYLHRLLTRTEGRIGEAARLAGIDPRSLYGLLRRHEVRKEDFKPQRRDPPTA